MEFDAMVECQSLMSDNYVNGLTDRRTYHHAVKALHTAYAQSNGFTPGACRCLSCTYTPADGN